MWRDLVRSMLNACMCVCDNPNLVFRQMQFFFAFDFRSFIDYAKIGNVISPFACGSFLLQFSRDL